MITRKILLNPGPATTTDTVKMAQVVPDICPREKEFIDVIREVEEGLLGIVHADPTEYAAVMFCGSGTICMDVALNSLLPDGRKVLIINNGAYSRRGVEICKFYHLPYINLEFPVNKLPDLQRIERELEENPDIALVYITHHETGTGLLNPVQEIGELAHRYHALLIADTTSSYAMLPINIKENNIDFCMASAQKGIMGITGLSYLIGRREEIEKSAAYPTRSYYCNLYRQYAYMRDHGEMHFTPPVQALYAARQAIREYFEEGEQNKWKRHLRVMEAISTGLQKLGFQMYIPRTIQSGLVAAVLYPEDENWDFEKIHDYCYERGFTIYPGKVEQKQMFRLCAFGAIDETDIEKFFKVFEGALTISKVQIPVRY